MSAFTRGALFGGFAFGLLGAGIFACSTTTTLGRFEEQPDSGANLPPSGSEDASPPRSNDAGEDASFVVPDGGVACDATPCVVALSGGGSSFCALLQSGKVACWGNNGSGQLGSDPGDFPTVSAPREIDGLDGVTHVSVNGVNGCARVSDGGVFCWGDADLVNLAHAFVPDDTADPPFGPVPPTREDLLPAAATIEVGPQVACITTATGALSCWGRNESSQLGRGPTQEYLAPPAEVTKGALAGKSVVQASSGDSQTFAILAGGELASWGRNGQPSFSGYFLGRDTSEDPDPMPALVPGVKQVRAVAGSFSHACAIAGRYVECWGYNDQGQLGRGWFGSLSALPDRSTVGFVAEAEDAGTADGADVPLGIALGLNHTCAALGGGRVYCWGGNDDGQLGTDPTTTTRTGQPSYVEGLSGPAVAVAAAMTTTCALLRNGTVECWGSNYGGELGIGTVDSDRHPHPARVSFAP